MFAGNSKAEEKKQAYISKQNFSREKHVILLMITDGEK